LAVVLLRRPAEFRGAWQQLDCPLFAPMLVHTERQQAQYREINGISVDLQIKFDGSV
jgi:hypothetical protein